MALREGTPRKVEIDEISMPEAEIVRPKGANYWGALRLLMGFTFLWAFLDKTFALGFATGRLESGAINFFGPDAWISGGSPTDGFLSFGLHTKEPFTSIFEAMVGSPIVEWGFMLGLLGAGIGLTLGIFTKIASYGAATLMVLMYFAGSFWPENNPVVDDHIVYAVVLMGLAYVGAGRFYGLGNRWRKTELVQKYPIFE